MFCCRYGKRWRHDTYMQTTHPRMEVRPTGVVCVASSHRMLPILSTISIAIVGCNGRSKEFCRRRGECDSWKFLTASQIFSSRATVTALFGISTVLNTSSSFCFSMHVAALLAHNRELEQQGEKNSPRLDTRYTTPVHVT